MCLHHPELLRHVAQTRSATMIATAAGSHGLEDRQSPCRGSSHFAVRQRRLPQIVRRDRQAPMAARLEWLRNDHGMMRSASSRGSGQIVVAWLKTICH